jgi:hypothetical protein
MQDERKLLANGDRDAAYEPSLHDVVRDRARDGRVGMVMDISDSRARVYLRPVKGGLEWVALVKDLVFVERSGGGRPVPSTEELSRRVDELSRAVRDHLDGMERRS